MRRTSTAILGLVLITGLSACGSSAYVDQPLGEEVGEGGFGSTTATNAGIMSGAIDAMAMLNERFRTEVPNTITFAFNSAVLTPEAQRTLDKQADWIRQFPELRFSVYGHTDLVGSNGYNNALGKRRAQAVVAYFASKGISKSRLAALVSYGKTRPVVATSGPEEANRRTVTEVAGFAKRKGPPLNGKYADIVFREYIDSAKRPHPSNTRIVNEVNPGE